MLEGLEASSEILDALRYNENLLFLPTEREYKSSVDEWKSFLFDAKPMTDDFFCSVVHNEITDSIDWGQIRSSQSC